MANVEDHLTIDEDDLLRKSLTCSKYQNILYRNVQPSCKAEFNTWVKLKIHVRRSHHSNCIPSKFKCPASDCKDSDKVFSRIQFLQNHYDCIHRQTQEFVCAVCQKKFSSSKSAARHEKDCRSGFLKCKWCSRSFSHNSSLSRHCRSDHLEELKALPESKTRKQGDSKGKESEDNIKYILLASVPTASEHGDNACIKVTPLHPNMQTLTPLVRIQPTPPKPSETQKSVGSEKRCTENQQVTIQQVSASQQPSTHSISTQSEETTHQVSTHQARQNVWSESGMWDSVAHLREKDYCTTSWNDSVLSSSYPELSRPAAGSEYSSDDKQLFSALDHITTQTDEFWELSEFSTQTYTEHNSFGTQTRCPGDDVLDSFMGGGDDLVEYLDGEVQTDTDLPDSASLALQTNMCEEEEGAFSNTRGCGVDRLDRDCQTYYFKNSTHTQTKMTRERALVVVDGLNSHTQTASPPNTSQSLYNESFTQTMDGFT